VCFTECKPPYTAPNPCCARHRTASACAGSAPVDATYDLMIAASVRVTSCPLITPAGSLLVNVRRCHPVVVSRSMLKQSVDGLHGLFRYQGDPLTQVAGGPR
jgi:hypothetical protein